MFVSSDMHALGVIAARSTRLKQRSHSSSGRMFKKETVSEMITGTGTGRSDSFALMGFENFVVEEKTFVFRVLMTRPDPWRRDCMLFFCFFFLDRNFVSCSKLWRAAARSPLARRYFICFFCSAVILPTRYASETFINNVVISEVEEVLAICLESLDNNRRRLGAGIFTGAVIFSHQACDFGKSFRRRLDTKNDIFSKTSSVRLWKMTSWKYTTALLATSSEAKVTSA